MKYINTLPHSKEKLNITDLLLAFYHVESAKDLNQSLIDDFVASFFLRSGSGILMSFFRGLYFKLFINYKFPAMIGASFKVINNSKIKIGKSIWIKDNVTFLAGGKINIGDGCVFCDRCNVWSGKEGLSIGNNCSLGIGGYVCGSDGKIVIGNRVIMADNVRLYSWNHKFVKSSNNYALLAITHKGITIGDNCWIGSGVIIVDGVVLGTNCVVGAGSVVTKSFPNNSIIVGVPAKIIKKI